ncbi:MAG: DUF2202 domain-containing protein [Methylococcaceae bacterium]|jgi:hypothetical protein
MRTTTKLIGFALALSLSSAFPALARGPSSGSGGLRTQQNIAVLSAAEEDTLLFMREEEKMARDVYQTLYKAWKKPVFKNIAASEQKHMDAVLKKINLFGLTDPALAGVGRFTNMNLQALYDQLIAQGKLTYIDALRAGATIEDVDIRDLMIAIEETNNLALKTTYENLLEGSKNHLRAFAGLLQKQGIKYSPQFIDQDLFDAILGV